jgi:hypothetical protein
MRRREHGNRDILVAIAFWFGMVVLAPAACSTGSLSPDAADVAVVIDAPICPRDPPAATTCAGEQDGMQCIYAEPPPSSCSTRCECRARSWNCDRPCTTGPCPERLPVHLASCSPPTLTCMYSTACGSLSFICRAFEVGAPPVWYCSGSCTCDAGADAAGDDGGG